MTQQFKGEQGPCFFGAHDGLPAAHQGEWRACCNHYMCDRAKQRYDLRIPAAFADKGVLGLARWALGGFKG